MRAATIYGWHTASMRLRKSKSAADEELLRLVNDGYRFLQEREIDFSAKMKSPTVDEEAEVALSDEGFKVWTARAIAALESIFPTSREAFLFARADSSMVLVDRRGVFGRFWGQTQRAEQFVRQLDSIRVHLLAQYTDLPLGSRLYVEDVDSFAKVRDVNPSAVSEFLVEGRLNVSEDEVQIALEQILSVAFHRRDWGGETNDLYTANLVVNGTRTATAFALKGNGCKTKELRIRDCGKNGDQLLRLLESPADLFVVQYIGPVSDAVIKDLASKVDERRARGRTCWFCIIDGQDTARLLRAYGKLPTGTPLRRGRTRRGNR